jgi:hypothetical protein
MVWAPTSSVTSPSLPAVMIGVSLVPVMVTVTVWIEVSVALSPESSLTAIV